MAQIVTITNPLTGQPAQVDQLDHTAQQIDDAVTRAIGYGLGASSKNVTDWNNEKTNGWVRDSGGTEGKHSPFVGLFSVGLISDYAAGEDAFQLAFARDQYAKTRTYIKFRAYNADNGVWGEWEWVNPPMQLGVEYRTTERYQGKPVYVKLIDFGALPNATSKYVDPGISNFDTLAEPMTVKIKAPDGGLHQTPFVSDTGIIARSWFKMASGGIAIRATDDRSSSIAYVTLKYTKTTD